MLMDDEQTHGKNYFQSQIKVVAKINNGVSRSKTCDRPPSFRKLWRAEDKFLASKLVFLSVFIIGFLLLNF